MQRRLLMGGGGSFPTPVIEPDLIALYNGSANGGLYGIGAASKAVGGEWTTYGSNPVLQVGSGGTWDDETVKDPWLLLDGSTYVMYYAGYNGTAYQVGRATASAHTGTWTKYASNPVITLGGGGAYDDAGIIFPVVLHEPGDTGREWKMWFTGFDGADWRIGYAYSSDGLSWTKHGMVVDLGAGGQWDDEGVVSAAIYKNGSTYNLFYGGTSRPSGDYFWQCGLVTFTDPEGTYTKSGSNPILQPVNLTNPDASEGLTATISAGGTVVTVGDTSHYTVGQALVLFDTDTPTEVHTVLSIDSGTQLTLAEVTAGTFTAAASGGIRPIDYLSVQPRTVRAAFGGGYEMYVTAFQAVSDLAVLETLREASLRYTASALTGPWTRDDTTGLMFPLYPANTGWDKWSAENTSVIAEP